VGIYGPNVDNDRKMLWDALVGLISWWDLPWCIGGDFNIICHRSERSSDTCPSPSNVGVFQSHF
jgi:hypothetical protein